MKKEKMTLEEAMEKRYELNNEFILHARVCNCSSVSIRNRPSFNGKPLHILPTGTEVTVLGDKMRQFVEVFYKDDVGYIDRRYLKLA